MRFVCDSCRAQYMISDEKVGAKGVKVRCKKCGFVILVRKPEPAAANEMAETQVMTTAAVDAAAPAASPSNDKPFEASGDGLFAGVDEDEIGAVFDQVLSGAPPAAAGPGGSMAEDDDEFVSTRVVDVKTLKKLANESSAPEEEAGDDDDEKTAVEAKPAPAAQHDWYVAIDEKQTGPLTLEKIKDLWDRGEVGADNLCWRAGFSDWLPLSEVGELAAVLAPKPAKPVISTASVSTAGNAVVDSPRDEGPSGAEAVSDWQPSAASALASLVQEEIQTLTAPPKKPEPAPMAPIASAPMEPMRGLIDAPPPDDVADAATVTRGSALPHDEEPVAPTRPTSRPPPSNPPAYAPPPYAYSAPPAGGQKKGLVIALSAGGALVVVLLLAVVYLLGRGERPVETAPTQIARTTPTPAPVQPPPSNPTPAPAPAPAPTTAAQNQTPPPAPTNTVATPPKPEVKQPEVKPAEPKAEVAQNDVKPKRERKHRDGAGEVAQRDVEPVKHEAAPPPPPPEKKKSGDAFDDIFGGGGDDSSSKPAASNSGESGGSKRHGSVYVPPAPGQADIPDTLEQSDIMKVVLDNKPSIVKCVNEQKAQDPSLSGRLVVRWTILTSGKTSGVQVRSDEFKRTHMATCIAGLVKSWKFPRHRTQGEPIDFPFTF